MDTLTETSLPLPADELAHVEDPLTDDDLADDPLRVIIGMFNSGLGDLAENHDKYLMECEMEINQRWFQSTATASEPVEADEPSVESPLEGFIGLDHSGLSDLAEHHDRYLIEFKLESNQPPPAALATDLP